MRRLTMFAATAALVLGACSSDREPADEGLTINGPAVVDMTGVSKVTLAPGDDPSAGTTGGTTAGTTGVSSPATSPAGTDGSDGSATTEMTTTSATEAVPTATFAPYDSEIYVDPAHWVCRGDVDDICDDPYPLTEVAADGTLTAVPYTVAEDPPADCFYVYPTVSGDPTFNSDLVPDSEIFATQFQAARFNQVCTLFAPVYRSVTSGGLAQLLQATDDPTDASRGELGAAWAMAYQDVLDAWRYYLANLNHGRPVVILAHSQGSFHVVTLLREEIDPDPAQRALILSAIVAGTSFQVAPGQDVGGDTQNMPLCRSDNQLGCVVTFQTYRDGEPPTDGALFGRPGTDTESACTNPGALGGGPALLDGAYPPGDWLFADPATAPSITTDRVGIPGLVTGECKVDDGYNYLAVTVNADPADPRADDIPGDGAPNWGLHTIDMNVAQDTLIDLVRTQTAAYLARP